MLAARSVASVSGMPRPGDTTAASLKGPSTKIRRADFVIFFIPHRRDRDPKTQASVILAGTPDCEMRLWLNATLLHAECIEHRRAKESLGKLIAPSASA